MPRSIHPPLLKNNINLNGKAEVVEVNKLDILDSKVDGLQSSAKTETQPKAKSIFDNFLVDRNRLAEILSLAPSTISKMMVDEGLPHYKIGKSCRFKVSEVMAFLEKRRRP